MDKRELKKKIKELPVNLGIASLALIFGLADGGAAAMSEILEGPSRGIGRSYRRMSELKTFWDYYDELKDLKKNSARTILWRLQKRGLVDKQNGCYELTSRGLNIVKIFNKKERPEKIWDGKWRLIMFDIPEKKRGKRDWLRSQLALLEYRQLQKSIFIGKQPIKKDLYEELLEQNLNQYVRLITIGEIDDEEVFNF